MTFNSIEFLLLLLFTAVLYFHLPRPLRNPLLLIASLIFYGWWNPSYLLLLLGTAAIDYLMVVFMDKSASKRTRKLWLIVSLVSNFGFLAFFKYSHFITDNINWLLLQWMPKDHAWQLPNPVAYPNWAISLFGGGKDWLFAEVVLPIGISFHTFQSMSYTIDAYYGNIQTERSFVKYLTFVSFFPQLVAGPIERASNLLPQLDGSAEFEASRVASGLRLILQGLLRKMVVADNLARLADAVYSNPRGFEGLPLILATYAFAFQIYCDFAGYSEIAVGTARIFGIRLMDNFVRPYFSTSIPEFWKRWHVSLSTWFRDYVYIPMGGNRVSRPRWFGNLAVTFLLSGLWHGANWTFVLWGAYHGALMIASVATLEIRERLRTRWGLPLLPTWVKALITFHLVALGWVLFRASSLSDAVYVLTHLTGPASLSPLVEVGVRRTDVAFAVAAVLAVILLDASEGAVRWADRITGWRPSVRWTVDLAGILVLLNLGAITEVPFIYFQF